MRYLVFGGAEYYPCGGADDLKGRFDDLDAALELCGELRKTDEWNWSPCDWVHIYDVQENKTIDGC